MINIISKNIVRFVLLVLLQVLILNNIQLGGVANPYLYVLFILLLPIDTPKWLVLLFGFIIGITIDIFTNTPGMHAAATTFMAYVRPFVLTLFAPREGYESTTRLSVQDMDFNWFLSYSGILILLHHLTLFYIEVFRFSEFFSTFSRALFSAAFTLVLVILVQFLFYRDKQR